MVHCCYVHVCFVQLTTCGAPNSLTRLGACTFLLLSHLLGSQNKYQWESVHTEARQRVGSTKQVSKLSLGQNKHRQNITTPFIFLRVIRKIFIPIFIFSIFKISLEGVCFLWKMCIFRVRLVLHNNKILISIKRVST